MRHLIFIAAAAAALSAAGCGGSGRYVQRGMDAYSAGDYPLALETFDWITKNNVVLNAKGHCRYVVYRGLTAVHLGKKDEGKSLLVTGKQECATDPRWLSPEITTEVDETLKSLP
jgi:hypothetical protein